MSDNVKIQQGHQDKGNGLKPNPSLYPSDPAYKKGYDGASQKGS